MEEMLMIEPPPASVMAGITAWRPRNTPSWLTRMTCSYSSAVVVASGVWRKMPALFTSTSRRPKASTAAATASAQASALVTSWWT